MGKSRMHTLCTKTCTVALLSFMMIHISHADTKIVESQVNAQGMSWASPTGEGNFFLRVTGPEGFVFEKTFTGTPPTLSSFGADGQYSYEITALPVISEETKKKMRMAREENDQAAMRSFQKKTQKQSGYFQVKGGVILQNSEEETRSTK